MKATIIPFKNKALLINARGESSYKKLEDIKVSVAGDAVLDDFSKSDVVEFLSDTGEILDEIEALLGGVESFISNRVFEYFEENEEMRDEVKKVFRMLDVINERVLAAKKYTSTSAYAVINFQTQEPIKYEEVRND